ncbi:hypothetical protein RQP46_002101 [Phenoliferia psychrophenolica]
MTSTSSAGSIGANTKQEKPSHVDHGSSYQESGLDAEDGQHGHVSNALILTVAWVACASFCFGFSYVTSVMRCVSGTDLRNALRGACIGGALVQISFATYFMELANLDYTTGTVSIYHAGGFFGVIVASYVSDRWGRKPAFLFASLFYGIGAIMMTAAQNLDTIFVGRLLTGIGAYAFLFASQIYVVELSPATSRGMLGSTVGISLELGYISAGWLSFGLSYWLGTNWSWRLPFLLQLFPLVLVLAGWSFVPESPRWLIQQGRGADALEVLSKLHKSPKDPQGHFSNKEHRQIESQVQLDKTLPSSWWSMFTVYKRRTMTVNVPPSRGLDSHAHRPSTLQGMLIIFGFLLAGDYFLATCRKVFLVGGLAGEGICLIILMLLSKYYGDGMNSAGKQAFVAMFLIYMLPLCITEPPAYLMACEIFPLHIRTKGTAISYATLAITNTWTLEAAATMVKELQWKAYLLFVCITAVNVAAYIYFLPETKNVPLEEMARLFGEEDQVALVSDRSSDN